MTSLPEQRGDQRLGLVIDLDTCVGCHACAVNCKQWNSGGAMAPLPDNEPYGAAPDGDWVHREHSFEDGEGPAGRMVHFTRSCLPFEPPACVTVCQTAAAYQRAQEGIVLRDEDLRNGA